MIAFFRRTLASKLALGLLALIVLAFILTGVATREIPGASALTGDDGDSVAKVGDQSITSTELDQHVRQAFARVSQSQPGLDLVTFVATGGFDQVVDQFIGAAALEVWGRHRLGLAASTAQVEGQIAGIQAFQGPTGKFDPQVFRAALAQQHIPEAQLRRDIAGDLVRQMVYLPASGAVTLPDGVIRPYASLLVEQRQGTIGLVPAQAFAGGAAPTDAELQRFYKAHLAAYTTPERRVLRYALIGRDQVAARAIPTEAEVRAVYDKNPQRFAAHETRTLSQVVLPTKPKADAFAAAVRGGQSFADAAKAAGFGPADTAVAAKTQTDFAAQSSPAVAAAAFALPQGGVTAPVQSPFGWHVVHAEAVTRTPSTPYEQARPQIAGDLAKARQDAALAALVNRVGDQLDRNTGFADIVAQDGLAPVETPPVTAGGLAPDQPGFKAPPEVQAMLKDGFQSAPDQAPTVETVQPNERYALLSVGRVIPAAPIPFAQARPRLLADFAAVRASERSKAVADAILAKVKAGTAMAAAFKAAPVALPAPQEGAGRRIDLQRAQAVPASLRALFTMTVGSAQLVPAEGGRGWYVVQLRGVTPADPKIVQPLIAGTRGDLASTATDEYLQELARAAGDVVGVKRNETALAQVRLRLLGAAPAAGAQ